MTLQGSRKADRAEVVERDHFATPNYLKSHGERNLLSPLADLKGSNVSLFIPAWTNNSKIEAFGLFTGQVGYAWNNVLWYVKGCAALTDDKDRGTVTATGALFDSASETRWGGVVGTGLEYGFAPNWSVAVEY